MSVRVTKQFKDDFEFVAAYWIEQGMWTAEEVEGLRGLMRKHELADGPDTLRDTLTHFDKGNEKLSAINNPQERYELWRGFFDDEAKQIRRGDQSGVNARIRASIETDKRVAA